MIDILFKGRGRFLLARAVGAAIVIFILGLITGLMTSLYWFVGVFVCTNIFMLLGDLIKHKKEKPIT